MKYIALFLVMFSGCAHVSDYGRGCRDGVRGLEPQLGSLGVALGDDKALGKYCDAVEAKNNKEVRK